MADLAVPRRGPGERRAEHGSRKNPMLSGLSHSPNYKYLVLGTVGIGIFGSVVDYGSVNIALPTIADHFETDIPTVQWVVIAYTLTISALLLPMGRLSDLVGRKRIYIAGMTVFIAGALLAGWSTSLPVLIVARMLQGCGAGMTQGTGMAIITSSFPSEERGKAIGLLMTTVGVGMVAGPTVGGLLVDGLGWRSVFVAAIPVGLVGLSAAWLVLAERPGERQEPGRSQGFDWPGAALSTTALVAFLLGMTNGYRFGWYSPLVLAAMLGFVVLMAAFVRWELKTSSPMLDLRLFRRRSFSLGVSANSLAFLGGSAVLVLMPFYLQKILGYSARQAGLITVPGAVCMALMGPISGRLSDRYGPRWFTVGGLAFSTTALFLFSRLTDSSPLYYVMVGIILQSTGMGIFYSPNTSTVLSAVDRSRYGVVSAFLNLVRNVSNLTSVALGTAIVTATMASLGYEPSLDAVSDGAADGITAAFSAGLRNAFVTMGCFMALGMALSSLIGERLPGRAAESRAEA